MKFVWTLIARVYSIFFMEPFLYQINAVSRGDGWEAVGTVVLATLLLLIIAVLWLVPFEFDDN